MDRDKKFTDRSFSSAVCSTLDLCSPPNGSDSQQRSVVETRSSLRSSRLNFGFETWVESRSCSEVISFIITGQCHLPQGGGGWMGRGSILHILNHPEKSEDKTMRRSAFVLVNVD